MTTLTIDVPDELAKQLEVNRDQIAKILKLGLMLFESDSQTGYVNNLDMMIDVSTLADIVEMRAPPAMQARIDELLDKNRAGMLTPSEEEELDHYAQIDYLMTLIKAHARKAR